MDAFFIRIAAPLALMLAMGQAQEPDLSKLPEPVDREVDFRKEIKPLLEKSCFGCHGARPRAKSKYFMNDREKTIKGGSSEEAAVVVGKSGKSPLVHFAADLIPELEMPPVDVRDRYPKLTAPQIALLRGWIDQGAKWPEDMELEMPPSE